LGERQIFPSDIANMANTFSLYVVQVFFWLRRSEEDDFESAFYFESNKVIESIAASLLSNLGAMDSFAAFAITAAKMTNQTWPFVTIPDFAAHAVKIRSLSDGLYVSLQPIVENRQRLAWEQYASENNAWVNESRKLQEADQYFYQDVSYNDSFPPTIFDLDGPLSYSVE
jgi:hypothetical protein